MQSQSFKHEAGACPRCKRPFVCRAGNISSCDCALVELSVAERGYVASLFDDCLCNSCLLELKYEHYLTHHHSKPSDHEITD